MEPTRQADPERDLRAVPEQPTGTAARQVLFRLLGPLDVRVGETPVELHGHRERAIVATLALRLGEVVPASQLADVIWGTSPPPTAAVQIQACVGALRKRLGEAGVAEPREVIVTRHPGYVLATASVHTDLARFRQLAHDGSSAARAGDHEQARELYRRGLALWRGEPFEDVTTVEFGPTSERLVDERLTAVENRIECDLGAGEDTELVAELTELVDRHPLRERLRGQLMLALHRHGRQADALAAYREGRDRLAEELGLDPGDDLSQLHEQILRNDTALLAQPTTDAPSTRVQGGLPVPQQLPADTATFVGRERLVGELVTRLEPSESATAPAVVCLQGGGGIGKTTLAVHLAHLVRDSFPDGQLYAHLAGTAGPAAEPGDVLSGALRAFGFLGDAVPESLAERVALFRSCLADRRVLLVLDDAADAAQVRPLLPPTAGSAVVVTSRPALSSLDGVHHALIETLADTEALDLLSAHVGAAAVDTDPTAASQIVDLCGRLPLAIRVAAARLTRTGGTPALDRFARRLTDERRRLDLLETSDLAVRATLLLSWETLTDEQRTLLRRLALLPATTFPDWVAAPLLDVDEDHGRDLLEDLDAAHLLDCTGDDPTGQTTYKLHDLVHLVARERLEAEEDEAPRQAVLGRLWDAWLGLTEVADALVPVSKAYVANLRPAGTAPPVAAEAVAAYPMHWFDTWQDQIVAVTQDAAAKAPRTAALLTIRLFGFLTVRRVTHLQAATAERALAADIDADLRARLALQICTAHGLANTPPADILPHAERAVALGRASGDRYLEYKARERLVTCLWELADGAAALRELDTLIPVARESDAQLHRQLLRMLGLNLVDVGRVDEGFAALRAAFDIPVDDQLAVCTDLHGYGRILVAAGHHAEGERRLRQCLVMLKGLGHMGMVAYVHLELAVAVEATGRSPEATGLLDEADTMLRSHNRIADHDLTWLEFTRGRVESLRGQHASAIGRLSKALTEMERLREPRRINIVRQALAEAYQRAGDRDRARAYLRQLPYAAELAYGQRSEAQ